MAKTKGPGGKPGDPQAAPASKPAGPPEVQMFGTLLASNPGHDVGRSTASFVSSIVVHVLLGGALVWATMAVGQEVVEEEQIRIVELAEEAPPPPPPPPPPPDVDVPPPSENVEVARGFQTLTVPDIVPPDIPPPQVGVRINAVDFSGRGVEGGRADGKEGAPPQQDLSVTPQFTPMTVRPELLNVPEVQRALVRNYPPLLRDAGIGGTTVMWFFIDENGTVVRTQLSKTSGYPALDEAAAKVAEVMKFSPAMNRDRKVQVWVEIPIQFQAR